MVLRACENCGSQINVRAADVARGWGRYCNKSCKAQHQAKRWDKPRSQTKTPQKAPKPQKEPEYDGSMEASYARRFPQVEFWPQRSYEDRWKGFEEWDAIAAEEDAKKAT